VGVLWGIAANPGSGNGRPQTVRTTGEVKMNLKMLLAVFSTVFIAELGDKTQLATILIAADKEMSRIAVFLAASCALVLACLLAVLLGSQSSRWVSPRTLKIIAGVGFVLLGAWTLLSARA
jgi:putative Ca2+/H+ antiporter (TMEM165/GDT1 family)